MRYLGQAKYQDGVLQLPESVQLEEGATYAVLEIEGDLWLTTKPVDTNHLAELEQLARQVIQEHRTTLERLAK